MSQPFYTDVSKWPICYVIFPDVATTESVNDYVARMDAYYERAATEQRPFAAVIDIRRLKAREVTVKLRQHFTTAIDAVWARHPEAFLCEALILDSPLLSAVCNAVNWMRRAKYPSRFFSDSEQGLAWVKAELARDAAASKARQSSDGSHEAAVL